MGIINLNPEKAQGFKNNSSNQTVLFSAIDINSKTWIKNFVSGNFPHDTDSEGNIYFKLIYNQIPPKTKRLKMYTKVPTNKHCLNQKDITVKFLNEKKTITEIIYKLSNEEYINFQNKLKIFLQNEDFFDSKYYLGENLNKNKDYKELLKAISAIKGIDYVNKPEDLPEIETQKVIKIYKMSEDMNEKLKNLGIQSEIEINNTITVSPMQYNILREKMPWIICDVFESVELTDNFFDTIEIEKNFEIPTNNVNSQVIGVIDSAMNLEGDFKNFIDGYSKEIEPNGISHFEHGNKVASLIIAHDELNTVKDHLGNFKVRHFEVSSKKPNGSQNASVNMEFLSRKLKQILEANQDIKVWNISLGRLKKEKNKR